MATKTKNTKKGPQLVDDGPKTPKAAKAEKPTKAAKVAEPAGRVSAAQAAGQALMECVGAPGSKSWRNEAKVLAGGGSLSKSAMENLRDNANQSAADAREAEDQVTAANLAAAVKRLRRVIRAA